LEKVASRLLVLLSGIICWGIIGLPFLFKASDANIAFVVLETTSALCASMFLILYLRKEKKVLDELLNVNFEDIQNNSTNVQIIQNNGQYINECIKSRYYKFDKWLFALPFLGLLFVNNVHFINLIMKQSPIFIASILIGIFVGIFINLHDFSEWIGEQIEQK